MFMAHRMIFLPGLSVVISSTKIFSSTAEDVTMLKVVSSYKGAAGIVRFATSVVPNVTVSVVVICSPSSTCTTLVEEVSSTDCVAIAVSVGDKFVDTIVGDTLVDTVDDMSEDTVSEAVVGNIE